MPPVGAGFRWRGDGGCVPQLCRRRRPASCRSLARMRAPLCLCPLLFGLLKQYQIEGAKCSPNTLVPKVGALRGLNPNPKTCRAALAVHEKVKADFASCHLFCGKIGWFFWGDKCDFLLVFFAKNEGGSKADLPPTLWLCSIRAPFFATGFFGVVWSYFCVLILYFSNIAK